MEKVQKEARGRRCIMIQYPNSESDFPAHERLKSSFRGTPKLRRGLKCLLHALTDFWAVRRAATDLEVYTHARKFCFVDEQMLKAAPFSR